jgi:hypothetical protein
MVDYSHTSNCKFRNLRQGVGHMKAGVAVEMFPVFELSAERKARIVESLDRRRTRKRDGQIFGMGDLGLAVLELTCELATGKRARPKCHRTTRYDSNGVPMTVISASGSSSLQRKFDIIYYVCSTKTLRLMVSFAQEDYQLSGAALRFVEPVGQKLKAVAASA